METMWWCGVSVVIILVCTPTATPFGFGRSEALYSEKDKHITVVEAGNFSNTIHNSNTAWMVEFYSSWCGHCIHFAPIYKDLSKEVANWKPLIRLAAIDCAQDVNTATCRQYDIMGYPTLKFFPPKAANDDLGETRMTMSKEIPSMKEDMIHFVERVAQNHSLPGFVSENRWPVFGQMTSDNVKSLWSSFPKGVSQAILILEKGAEANAGRLAYFDQLENIKSKRKDLMVIFVDLANDHVQRLLKSLQVSTFGETQAMILALKSDSQGEQVSQEILYTSSSAGNAATISQMVQALSAFVDKNANVGDNLPRTEGRSKKPDSRVEDHAVKAVTKVTREEDIKRRRYTVFMSDLENALLYSLKNEIGARAMIAGKALTALREYTDVLAKHFPGRPSTMEFLEQIRNWVYRHDDAIRGEDLVGEMNDVRASTGAFSDNPGSGVWIGCKGSKPIFGGYPCGLWQLWHTLTVNANEAAETNDPNRVLSTMVLYVDHFFGCRDCARHFLQVAENGAAVRKEVTGKNSGVLWLWRAHNKANQRLSGDVTDDKAFPKEVWPNREHCSDCYNNLRGTDLWSEFRQDHVVDFMKSVYGLEHISYEGLKFKAPNVKHESHDLVLVGDQDEAESASDARHDHKYSRSENQWFFGPMDMSLCIAIYIVSGVILFVVYVKFVAKKKVCSFIYGLFSNGNHHKLGNSMRGIV